MIQFNREWKPLAVVAGIFVLAYYLPVGQVRFDNAIVEALQLVKWYAREHVVLCLLPAFLIAGAIAAFVGKASVMKYLGSGANKVVAYGVASVSGSVLAVCSCTILPLFAGIYRMGAGLGPASAFLYSGPAINVLAIILTARVLGLELGVARAIGAVVFSILIGLLMHLFFRKEEKERQAIPSVSLPEDSVRPLWQTGLYFGAMVAILVFANWGRPESATGLWSLVYSYKWAITAFASVALGVMLIAWFGVKWIRLLYVAVPTLLLALVIPDYPAVPFVTGIVGLAVVASMSGIEMNEWMDQSWTFAKQILPLLLVGVVIAGVLLGRPGGEGIIPSQWISNSVGGNSIWSNLFASVVGAFMYFATLTEVPILQGLIGSGMGKGPALALLLAGPALSLPNMIVIRSVIGTKKTVVFVMLVVIMSTATGMAFGALF